MKIGIVSDSHDRPDALAHAMREAKRQGAAVVIHCGAVKPLVSIRTLHRSRCFPRRTTGFRFAAGRKRIAGD